MRTLPSYSALLRPSFALPILVAILSAVSASVATAFPSGYLDELTSTRSMPGQIRFMTAAPGDASLAIRRDVHVDWPVGNPFPSYFVTSSILRSTEGLTTWNSVFDGREIRTLAQGNGVLVVAGDAGLVRASTDGETWTEPTFDVAPVGHFTDSAFMNGQFYLIAGQDGTFKSPRATSTPDFYRSADGIQWTKLGSLPSPAQLLAAGNGVFVTCTPLTAASNGSLAIMRSTDGITWVIADTFILANSVSYAGGRFIVADGKGKTLVSTDGLTWSSGPNLSAPGLTTDSVDLRTDEGRFLLLVRGRDPSNAVKTAILTSYDGETWDQRGALIPASIDTLQSFASGFAALAWSSGSTTDTTLYTNPAAYAEPSFTETAPAMIHLPPGNSTSLSVKATGGSLNYQWYEGDSGDTSHPLSGAVDRIMQTPPRLADTQFWVRVTNSLGLADGSATLVHAATLRTTGGLFVEGTSASPARLIDSPSGSSFQWSQNGTVLPGETSQSVQPKQITLAKAGEYTVEVIASSQTLAAEPASVGVVRVSPVLSRSPKEGTSLSFQQIAAGPGLRFQWKKNGIGLADAAGKIAGSRTSKLTLSKVRADDTGTYTCEVSLGDQSQTGDTIEINVLGRPIVKDLIVPAPPAVGRSIEIRPEMWAGYTAVEALGIPPGLRLDRRTGLISGTPTRPGSYKISIRGINRYGVGPWMSFTLEVASLPQNVEGTFTGLVGRMAGDAPGLGGLLQLNVLPSASYTGSVDVGSKRYPFTGQLSNPGVGQLSIGIRIASGWMTLALDFDATQPVVTGAVSMGDGSFSLSLLAKKVRTGSTAWTPESWRGKHFLTLSPALSTIGNPLFPQEQGLGQVNMSASGTWTWTGRLSDGSAYSMAGRTSEGGQFAARTLLYGAKGSIQGWQQLASETGYISGTLEWMKNPVPGAPSFPQGVPLHTLTVSEQ